MQDQKLLVKVDDPAVNRRFRLYACWKNSSSPDDVVDNTPINFHYTCARLVTSVVRCPVRGGAPFFLNDREKNEQPAASISRITVCAMGYGAGRRVLYCHGDSWHPSGFWAVHGANIERAWHWLTDIFPGDCSTESVVGGFIASLRGTCRQDWRLESGGAWRPNLQRRPAVHRPNGDGNRHLSWADADWHWHGERRNFHCHWRWPALCRRKNGRLPLAW